MYNVFSSILFDYNITTKIARVYVRRKGLTYGSQSKKEEAQLNNHLPSWQLVALPLRVVMWTMWLREYYGEVRHDWG
jgi:hypothetical protein